MHDRYVTDKLKMCMKKFNAEKIIFDKFTRFLSALCGGYTVSLACSQFLVYVSGAQFEGDLGEILALGAEISPYVGLREKWESPLKKKIFFFLSFHLVSTP